MSIDFLKLNINIFDHKKIKIIRKYPGGDQLFIVWLWLLCESMKSDHPGYVYIAKDLPYERSDIAADLNLEIKTVELAMELFTKLKMVDVLENGVIEVLNFNKYQRLDKIEKARELSRETSRRYRQKKRKEITDLQGDDCSYCDGNFECVEHIIPLSKGGIYDDDMNMITACKSCNAKKGSMDVSKFVNKNRNDLNIDKILTNKKLKRVMYYENGIFYMKSDASRKKSDAVDLESDKTKTQTKKKIDKNLPAKASVSNQPDYSFKKDSFCKRIEDAFKSKSEITDYAVERKHIKRIAGYVYKDGSDDINEYAHKLLTTFYRTVKDTRHWLSVPFLPSKMSYSVYQTVKAEMKKAEPDQESVEFLTDWLKWKKESSG